MAKDPVAHVKDLMVKYTVISHIPDIDRYRRIVRGTAGSCIFRGCTEPIAWEDARGGNFLCEGHYRIVKRWIDEARRGLVSGGHSAIFMENE